MNLRAGVAVFPYGSVSVVDTFQLSSELKDQCLCHQYFRDSAPAHFLLSRFHTPRIGCFCWGARTGVGQSVGRGSEVSSEAVEIARPYTPHISKSGSGWRRQFEQGVSRAVKVEESKFAVLRDNR